MEISRSGKVFFRDYKWRHRTKIVPSKKNRNELKNLSSQHSLFSRSKSKMLLKADRSWLRVEIFLLPQKIFFNFLNDRSFNSREKVSFQVLEQRRTFDVDNLIMKPFRIVSNEEKSFFLSEFQLWRKKPTQRKSFRFETNFELRFSFYRSERTELFFSWTRQQVVYSLRLSFDNFSFRIENLKIDCWNLLFIPFELFSFFFLSISFKTLKITNSQHFISVFSIESNRQEKVLRQFFFCFQTAIAR